MYKKRKFKNKVESIHHLNNLMAISAMPRKEKDRWEKVIPFMEQNELYKLQNILENEISELADIYLQAFQRKNDARTFNAKTDIKPETFFNKETTNKALSAINDISESEVPSTNSEANENSPEKTKEIFLLQKIIQKAYFLSEDQKNVMLEVSERLSVFALKEMQNIIIRMGQKDLEKRIIERKNNKAKFES